jgi:hypothetical protein
MLACRRSASAATAPPGQTCYCCLLLLPAALRVRDNLSVTKIIFGCCLFRRLLSGCVVHGGPARLAAAVGACPCSRRPPRRYVLVFRCPGGVAPSRKPNSGMRNTTCILQQPLGPLAAENRHIPVIEPAGGDAHPAQRAPWDCGDIRGRARQTGPYIFAVSGALTPQIANISSRPAAISARRGQARRRSARSCSPQLRPALLASGCDRRNSASPCTSQNSQALHL